MKRILIYLSLLVVAAILPAAGSAQSLTWHTDQILYSSTYDAISPSVAISGDNAVAVWTRATSGQDRIYASRSTDKGQNWSTPVLVDFSTLQAAEPQVAVSGSNVVVVFRQFDGVRHRIYANYSTNAGASWGGAQLIENNAGYNGYEPQAAISGSNVVAIWKQSDGSNDRIYANYSTNGGATWGTDRILDGRAYNAQEPRLAMSGNNVVAVWAQNDGTTTRIFSAYSANAGSTWADDQLIEPMEDAGYSPSVAISGNNVVVVWLVWFGSPIECGWVYSNRASFSGGTLTWTQANTQRIDSNNAMDGGNPRVAISDNNVVAVWEQYEGSTGVYHLYTANSGDTGATWNTNQLLVASATIDGANPRVAVSGSNVAAVWMQDEGVYRIYARHSFDGGENWEDPELIEDNAGSNAYSPQVAVSGNDVVSVWYQMNGGYYAVFANYAAFSSGGFIGPGGSGGGGGGCFIATAAFGTPLAKQVEVLRQFRDRYLLTNAPGRKFVAWYYRNGPVAAKFIENRPLARAAVQAGLYPLIGFSFLLVNGFMPLVMMGLLLAVFLYFRFRPKRVDAE